MRSLKKTISLNQAAKISGYTQDHLGYLIRKGEIKGEKKAGIWLTSEDDVKRYISRQKNLHKKIVVKNFISRYFVRSVLVLGSILLVGSFLIGFKVYGNYNNNSQSILSILSSSVSNEVSKVYNSLTKGDQAITSSHLTASASTSGIDLFSSVGNKLTSISDGLAYGWSEFTFGLLDNVEEFLFNTKKFSNALKSGSLFSPKKNTVAQISPTPSQKENKQNNSADKKQSQKSIEDNVVAVAPKIITNRIIEKTKTVIVNQTDRSLLSRIEGLEKSLLGLISFNDRQTIATQDSSSKHVASSAKSITEGGTLNDSVLNDATLNGLTTLNGSTNLLNSFSQTGPNTFSTGTGVVSLNGPTNIAAGNSFTSNGQALFTRVPTLAHIFSSTWPAGVSNVDDSSIYVNPLSAVADGNLIGAAVNGNVKFLVDAEGDIYGNNLILQGSTTSASNTIGTLNVTDNTTLGDADTDSLTIRSNIIDLTGSAPVIDSIAGPLYINSKTNNLVNFGSGIVTIPSLSVTTATGITASMVGLGNVTNESKATMFTSPTFTGSVSGFTMGGDLAFGSNIFTTSNSGLVSNLNADYLDGQHGSYYQPLLTNPVTGTGIANYLPKLTGASTLGNSLIYDNGTNIGIGTTTPTAYLNIKAGTATAGTAPLKLTSGVLNTTAEVGAIEYNGTNLYFTPNTTRYLVTLSTGTSSQFLKGDGSLDSNTYALSSALSSYVPYTGATGGVTLGANTLSTTSGLISPKLYPSADSTTAIQFNKANGTTNVMNIDTTNGRVGIGTTTPNEKLHVVGNSYTTGYQQTIGEMYTGDGLWFGNDKTVGIYKSTSDIRFKSTTDLMTILSSGSVGIGTTTPTAYLNIKAGTATAGTAPLKLTSGVLNTTAEVGAIEFLTDAFYGTITTGAARKQFAFTDTTSLTNYVPYTGATGGVTLGANTLSTTSGLISPKLYPSADSTTAIQFNKANGMTNVMNIDTTNGYVGIGTTTPTSALEIKGILTIDNPTNSDTATLSLTNPYYGRLNYSVTPENGKSEVRFVSKGATAGSGQTYFVVASTEAGDTGNNLLMGVAAGNAFITNAYNYAIGGALQLGGESWNGTGAMTISAAGKVGIGITNSTAYLNIKAGTATAGTAPLKLTSGVLNTTAEVGAIEFLTDAYYGTITTGAARKQFAFTDTTSLTNYVPYTGATGGVTLGANTLSTTSGLISPKLYPSADSTTAIQFNKANGTTNVMNIDTTNGYVGIGTTTPVSTFDVNGGATLRSGLTMRQDTLSTVTFVNSLSNAYTKAIMKASEYDWEIGTTSKMVMDTNGNVGIGTTAPTAYLNIKAGTASAGTAPLKLTSGVLNTTAEVGAIEFLTDAFYGTITTGAARKQFAFTSDLTSYVPYTGATGAVTLGANTLSTTSGLISPKLYPSADSTTAIQFNKADGTTNVMNIDTTNGRVGIGTTAPGEKLAVNGNIISNGIVKIQSADGTYPNAGFYRNSTPSSALGQYGINTGTDFDDFGNADNNLNGGVVRIDARTNQPTIQFLTRSTGNSAYPTSKMVITNGGNVGIGTTTPTAYLNIKAGTATAGTAPLKLTSGVLNTTAEVGAIEFLTDAYYGTITTGAARKQFAFTSDLTSYVPYTGGTSNVDLGVHNLTVDTNSLFVDSVNHRVGVGTTTPTRKLEVNGIILANNDSYTVGDGSFIAGGLNPTVVQRVQRSGGGYAYSLFNGFADNTTTGLSSKILDYGAFGNFMSGVTPPTIQYAYFGVGSASAYDNTYIRLYNNANKVVSFDGSVGIGTTSPTNLLSLGGTAARTIWMERNSTAATAGQGLTLSSGGAIAGTADLAGGDLILKSGIATGTGSSALRFFTATPQGSTNTTDNTPTEKMTILGNGNVGVGTTTPGGRLQIAGTSGSVAGSGLVFNGNTAIWQAADTSLTIRPAGTDIATFLSTGVGIGTTTPTATLQVAQGTVGAGTISNSIGGTTVTGVATQFLNTFKVGDTITANGETRTIATIVSNTSLTTDAWTGANAGVVYTLVGGTRFSVLGNGNVGIGTTAPQQKLDVSSTTVTTEIGLSNPARIWKIGARTLTANGEFVVRDGTLGLDRFVINKDGNVGIGTTSPTAYLNIKAGSASAGTAPLKLTSGVLNTTAEVGAIEFLTDAFYGTITTGAARKQFAFTDTTSLTNYVPYTGATGAVTLGANTLSTTSGLISPKLYPSADSTTAIQFNKANGTTNVMNIDTTNGYVGVGTTSPLDLLVVSKTVGANTGEIRFGSGNGRTLTAFNNGGLANFDFFAVSTYFNSNFILASQKQIQMYNYAGTNPNYSTIYTPSNENLTFRVNGSDRMSIDSTGNVGIGTTTPTAYLNIKAGTATAGTAPLKLTSGVLNTTAEVGAIEFLTDAYYGTITTGAARKQFAFTSDLTSYVPYTGATGAVTLGANTLSTTSGLISPKLYPSADSTTAIQFNKANGTTNVMNIDTTNGYVGIGTTSPSTKLEIGSLDLGDGVAGPVLTLGRNTNATNTGAGSINFLAKGGTAGYIWQDAAGKLRINTSAPSNANDTAGTVIGDQTSIRDTKQDILDYTDYSNALKMVVDAPLHTFRYIKEVDGYGAESPLAKERIGFIADEVDKMFMVGNSIDQVSVNGIMMASIKEMNLKIVNINNMEVKNDWRDSISVWFANSTNGIGDFFSNKVHTKEICMTDDSGAETCINKTKLDQLLVGQAASSQPTEQATENNPPSATDTPAGVGPVQPQAGGTDPAPATLNTPAEVVGPVQTVPTPTEPTVPASDVSTSQP